MLPSFKRMGLLFLLQLLLACSAYALVLPDSLLVKKVNEIHGNMAYSPAQKIPLFKQLQLDFFKSGIPKSAAYALLVHRLGDAYHKTGDAERAVFYTREAVLVNSSGKSGTEPAFLVNSYFNLAIFYKRLHLPKASHHYFNRCITAGSKYPDKYFIVFMAFEQQAYAYYQTGDYQQAVLVADEGLRFAAGLKDQNAKPPLLAQRAQSAGELSLFAEAEADVKQAIAMLEKAGNEPLHLATCYSVYAALLSKTRQPKAAITYYRKAFELNRANGNPEQSARDLQDMGCVYADELKASSAAMACYRRGIELAKASSDVYQLSALYSNIGVVYGHAKDYGRALFYYQKALNTMPLNFEDTSLKANPDLQMLKLVANDYFMVTILSNKGSALLERYKQKRKREDLTLALATYELADRSLDLMRWKQTGTESKLVWRKNTREMYEKCIEVCYQLKAVNKAYYFFEKSRGVLLNDHLNKTAAEGMLPEKDRKREQQLRIKADVLSDKLLSSAAAGAGYMQLKQAWLIAQEKWEGFIAALERKYPAYYSYKYDRRVYPYAGVSDRLSKDQASFVSYFNGDKAIYALMLSGQRQRLVKIDYPGCAGTVRELTALFAQPAQLNQNFGTYRKLAFGLHNALFKHLGVATERVIISQDGHFIPFEAMLSDTLSPSAYLARKYAFSYVPTFSVLMNERPSGKASADFLGIAPLNYASKQGLSNLHGSEASLEKIAAGFKQPVLLTGAAASKPAFLKNVTRYGLVQLYAHADASADAATALAGKAAEPVLYLADASVQLSEIQKLKFDRTELVVLSACNTGIGKQASGEGIFSMARGFMAAGVPASITNLWQVEDRVTYKLTEAFYAHLQEGLPKDVALNTAKLDLMDTEDRLYSLPYYWAATVLIGDAGALPVSDTGHLFSWIVGTALIAFSGLFFWFKRK